MDKLKVLKTYPTQFEAELVKSKLESEGIEAVLQSADMANVLPSLDYAEGIHLMVEPEDFDEATAIVDSVDDDVPDDMELGIGE